MKTVRLCIHKAHIEMYEMTQRKKAQLVTRSACHLVTDARQDATGRRIAPQSRRNMCGAHHAPCWAARRRAGLKEHLQAVARLGGFR
jgi:hypothetical protein